jgi:hypothetical protein
MCERTTFVIRPWHRRFATFSSEGEAEDHKARFCARHRNYRKKLKRNKGEGVVGSCTAAIQLPRTAC